MKRFRAVIVMAAFVLCGWAGADDLQPVDPGTVTVGNFYSMADVEAGGSLPPLPFDPYPELGLYLWSEGVNGGLPFYLYDDRNLEQNGFRQFSMESFEPPPDPGGGGGGEDPGVPPGPEQYWDSMGLSILPPVFDSPNSLALTATNTDVGAVFDVYYTTNLALLPSPELCRTNWAWLMRGVAGQTVFGITNLPQPQCYFRLGNALIDTDGDGLPDAYEILVSHTNPVGFNSLSSDGYGTPDGWYLAHNLNPKTTGIGDQDPDQDGLANRREYLWGSDPEVSEGLTVWVGCPTGFSGAP